MAHPESGRGGIVKYADDSIMGRMVSAECADGRCGECPDSAKHGPGGLVARPALHHGYCEHNCPPSSDLQRGQGGPDGPLADRQALDAIQHMLRDPQWSSGMLEDIARLVGRTGREVANLPGDEPTWARH